MWLPSGGPSPWGLLWAPPLMGASQKLVRLVTHLSALPGARLLLRQTQRCPCRRSQLLLRLSWGSPQPLRSRVRGSTPEHPTKERMSWRLEEKARRVRHSCRSPTFLPSPHRPLTKALVLVCRMRALVPISSGGTGCRRLHIAARDDLGRVLLVIDDEENRASAERLRRSIRRQAASAEEMAATAMVCPLRLVLPLA